MFREKVMMVAPKKEDVIINMVLAITTYTQIPENIVVLSKEKKPHKNENLAYWQKEEKFQHSFEEAIKNMQ
jgi:hypothetical protein